MKRLAVPKRWGGRGVGTLCHTGEGSPRVRRQRERVENVGKNLYCGSHGKEQVRQGERAWDRLI